MDRNTVASMIDHAILKPQATADDVKKGAEIAARFGIASLIVKPTFVKQAKELLKDTKVKVGCVIGFPHGISTTRCKVEEALDAIRDGADELDMVMNIGEFMSGNFEYVKNDMKQVAEAAHQHGILLKAILEIALLPEEMKAKACRLAEEAGVDYVKTATGFNGGGATLHDVEIMVKTVSPRVKVKAAGGIRTFEQAVEFIQAGCSRLGTSATETILSGGVNTESY